LNYQMKVCILNDSDVPSILYQRVGKFNFYSSETPSKYFYYFLKTPYFKDWLNSSLQGSDQPFINQTQLEQFILPLCTGSETHRIVAKVDELMALCDQLKERLQHASDTQLNLTDAIVEQALN